MLSRQEELAERRAVLENDKRSREQGSTFLAHTHNDVGGRFTAHERSTVIGSTPTPASAYPAGPNWTCDPVGPEMPLGYSIEDHEPVGQPHELRANVRPLEQPQAQGNSPNPALDNANPTPPPGVERSRAGLGSFYRRA